MDEKKNMRMVVEEVKDDESTKIEEIVKKEVKPVEQVKAEEPPIKEAAKEEPIKKEEEIKPKKESSFNILWILIPGMLLLGLLIGGIFAYVFGIQKISDTNKADTSETQNVTVEPTASTTAKPEASPNTNLSKYKIKILNGSGISGEAGKVQTLVEAAGFTVLSTGNATSYDYKKTQITLKTGIDPDFVSALITALKKNYQLEDTKTVSSQTNDVTVIVGSLKAI
jgi:outer membrane biosynthesis protein TonB